MQFYVIFISLSFICLQLKTLDEKKRDAATIVRMRNTMSAVSHNSCNAVRMRIRMFTAVDATSWPLPLTRNKIPQIRASFVHSKKKNLKR